jgi:glutamate dehydrogenase
MSLYRPLEAPPGDLLRFKLFRLGRPVSLSAALPMLENMGLRVEHERPSEVKRADAPRVWMHDFGWPSTTARTSISTGCARLFQDAFGALWRGEIENDGFNRLVLGAGLSAGARSWSCAPTRSTCARSG